MIAWERQLRTILPLWSAPGNWLCSFRVWSPGWWNLLRNLHFGSTRIVSQKILSRMMMMFYVTRTRAGCSSSWCGEDTETHTVLAYAAWCGPERKKKKKLLTDSTTVLTMMNPTLGWVCRWQYQHWSGAVSGSSSTRLWRKMLSRLYWVIYT